MSQQNHEQAASMSDRLRNHETLRFVVGRAGEILIDGKPYRARELAGYAGQVVWACRESDHEVNVWSRKSVHHEDCYLICVAVAADAPFFLRSRFGAANQPHAWDCLDREEVSHAVRFSARAGRLHVEVDACILENPGIERDPSFDPDRWADDMIGMRSSGCDRVSFRQLYSLARALRRGLTVTLNGDDPPNTILCPNYWQPERRRLLPAIAANRGSAQQ